MNGKKFKRIYCSNPFGFGLALQWLKLYVVRLESDILYSAY